jgi:flagellar motor protein MotB
MNPKHPDLAALFVLVILGASFPFQTGLADSSDGSGDDGTTKTYYWQGHQLNNLGRLGSSADFEEEQRHAREGKESDQYLATIRERLAHQAAKDAQQKNALTFEGELSNNPVEVTYLSPGMRVTLHAEALFDENSATMKIGAMDTLDRLHALLETESQKPLQFVIADRLDDIPDAKSLDAERSLVVLSMLEMPKKGADQEDLTPEVLTR